MTFDELKKVLISVSCLILSDSNDEFEIIINISKDVKIIGMILIQNDHFMIYKSMKLNLYQFNYLILSEIDEER